MQQDSVPQRRVDETEVKQLLQDSDDNIVVDDHDAIAGVPTVVEVTKAATAHLAPATLSELCAVIPCISMRG